MTSSHEECTSLPLQKPDRSRLLYHNAHTIASSGEGARERMEATSLLVKGLLSSQILFAYEAASNAR
jgi:hypothetical protein